ncbi:hypothetical protein BVRB_9g222070 [Beta vulgaris subsp. vulgaris]|nr:hypothetical protein BVRB_9g222070 [Beta vulgaris subsp. vulgaris]
MPCRKQRGEPTKEFELLLLRRWRAEKKLLLSIQEEGSRKGVVYWFSNSKFCSLGSNIKVN